LIDILSESTHLKTNIRTKNTVVVNKDTNGLIDIIM